MPIAKRTVSTTPKVSLKPIFLLSIDHPLLIQTAHLRLFPVKVPRKRPALVALPAHSATAERPEILAEVHYQCESSGFFAGGERYRIK